MITIAKSPSIIAACGLLFLVIGSASAQSTYTYPYSTSTIAGVIRTPGSVDGSPGEFQFPFGVAVDTAGNLYVGDTYNDSVRKITPGGAMGTLAGLSTIAGSADGVGSGARFSNPEGVAVDGAGNVYVADITNDTIRKITPAGAVTTLAGQAGASGSADGTGSAARFNGPAGVAVDAAGNVYVADAYNQTIRKITASGVVTTLAGQVGVSGRADGTGSGAQFYLPSGVAVDSAGVIYVSDTYNDTIRKITAAGVVSTLAGQAGSSGSADGNGGGARFYLPLGLAVDLAGNVYVADTYNDTIRKITPTGSVSTLVGLAGTTGIADGTGNAARFFTPYGVAVDSVGNLYIADTLNIVLRKAVVGGGSGPAPSFSVNPTSQTVVSGTTVVFNAAATGGSATTYQWSFNGSAISGATSTLLVVPAATAGNVGTYACTATNSAGSVKSASSTLSLANTANVGRLINLSVNVFDGSGAQALTVGFVTGGSGTSGSQTLLARASGPALVAFGQSGVMSDPTLTILNNLGTVVATNAGWGSPAANQTAVTAADTATYAFPLTDPTSLDSAIVIPLPQNPGYSMQVASKSGGTGRTLAEVYDNTPSGTYTASTPRLINLSCRIQVGAGSSLTEGFTVGGTTSKTVLIRASGPALTSHGVSGVMADPQLKLFDSTGAALLTNAGWGGDPQLTAAMTAVFAFGYTDGSSKDSALLVTLPPGSYTAQATSVSGAAGTTLVEVYELP